MYVLKEYDQDDKFLNHKFYDDLLIVKSQFNNGIYLREDHAFSIHSLKYDEHGILVLGSVLIYNPENR